MSIPSSSSPTPTYLPLIPIEAYRAYPDIYSHYIHKDSNTVLQTDDSYDLQTNFMYYFGGLGTCLVVVTLFSRYVTRYVRPAWKKHDTSNILMEAINTTILCACMLILLVIFTNSIFTRSPSYFLLHSTEQASAIKFFKDPEKINVLEICGLNASSASSSSLGCSSFGCTFVSSEERQDELSKWFNVNNDIHLPKGIRTREEFYENLNNLPTPLPDPMNYSIIYDNESEDLLCSSLGMGMQFLQIFFLSNVARIYYVMLRYQVEKTTDLLFLFEAKKTFIYACLFSTILTLLPLFLNNFNKFFYMIFLHQN